MLLFLRLRVVITVAAIAFVCSNSVTVAQLVVAHRGASADGPENTLAAFRLAWDHGADAVEGDFYLTKDQQIVALHDKSTKRTSGVDWDVREQSLVRLQTLDVGKWKGVRFSGERIPTLKQVSEVISTEGRLVLEIKDSPRIVPFLAKAIENTPALTALVPDRLIIIAFDDKVVSACKKLIPEVKALWLTGFNTDESTGEITPSIGSILGTLARARADGLDCNAAAHINEQFARQLRNAGYEFHVWTVNDPAVAVRFQRLGVDSITTDRPAVIRKALTQASVAVP